MWTSDCQNAFEAVKLLLCSAPVLAAPDFALPFKLVVDARALGAGAVLLQEDIDGIDHPVSFFSRKFNKHQLNYSTIEKEAPALLLALLFFEVYIGSSSTPVKVFTDHNPFVFLSRMYNQNQRLIHWSLILQPYNLDIHHI
uniref:Reverse transcriptase/retrotransposon-derived protein RNase H-like domain-containing protein n=1 Tax=Anguilla anguilla TaxID=7936 RepID=A0A0E9WSF6_ANGAN